ncbi:MAG: dephospho-CoA kinase [Gammaproteobacteria bacterium]|nr:dephospho-CoA kinase [Gammaproteobacteria bacterium]
MLIIGLTGGIGSGKSTVSELFANLGVPIIDTDAIARELVSPGHDALEKIIVAFGKHLLTSEGELDRGRLRELVFNDPQKRETLEAILHPLIKQAALERIRKLDHHYCILVVPLLVEKGWYTMVDRVLVVDSPLALQRQRVKQRNGLSDSQIDAILCQQASREQRLGYADDVIENTQSIQHIENEVNTLHRKYRELSRQDSATKNCE